MGLAADRLWDAYFHYVAGLAERLECRFLAASVRCEVTLRNAAGGGGPERLGLEAADYLVAADLAVEGEEWAGVVTEWASSATPLAGRQVLLHHAGLGWQTTCLV